MGFMQKNHGFEIEFSSFSGFSKFPEKIDNQPIWNLNFILINIETWWFFLYCLS